MGHYTSSIFAFAVGGDLTLLLLLFFLFWYTFYGMLPFVATYLTAWCGTIIWRRFTRSLIPLLNRETPSKKQGTIRRVYTDLGLIKVVGGKVIPGNIVKDFALRLKEVLSEKPYASLSTRETSHFLVVEFAAVFIGIVEPQYHLSFGLYFLLICFGAILVLVGFFTAALQIVIEQQSDSIISLAKEPSSTSNHFSNAC